MSRHNRITLRPPELSDAELILAWENDPKNQIIAGEDWNGPYSLEDIEELIKSLENSKEQLRMMIELEGACIGAVDAFNIDREKKSAGIGILIAEPSKRRKGYASQAIEQLQKQLQRSFGIRRFTTNIQSDNKGSIALFSTLGYSKVEQSNVQILTNADYIQKFELRK